MRRFLCVAVVAGCFIAQSSAMPFAGQVGVNLGDVPFVDMVKSAGAFEASGGGALTGAALDASGWPNRDFRMLLLDSRPVAEWSGVIDDPAAYRADYAGVYKGSFTGSATGISIPYSHGSVSNLVYTAASNTSTFDLTLPSPSSGYCFTLMQFTGTRKTSSSATNTGITNLKIIRPGYGTAPTKVIADELFTALASGGFSTVRAMGLTNTAMMPVVYPARTTWAQRKLLTDAQWRAFANKLDGAPWEVLIDLCNEADVDMWANIPISADSTYIRELAILIHGRLKSSLNVYIEIDNEVWGYDSPKNYNIAEAAARGLANPIFNLALRLASASMTFESVFGAGSLTGRVRPVVAWWIAMRNEVRGMLTTIQNTYTPRPVNDIVYGIAPAMYYSIGSTAEENPSLTVHQLSELMFKDISNQTASRVTWVSEAARFSLKGGLLCYEGGPHTPSANTASAPNLANKITMHRTEHMPAQMLFNMREGFFDIGANLFMAFTLSSGYNRYGCWGITDDLKLPQRNEKMRSVRELHNLTATPLPPGAFYAHVSSPGTIDLTWNDYATGETGFIVEAIDSATGTRIGAPDTVAANAVSKSYSGLPSTSARIYRIRAFNASGLSTYARAVPSTAPPVRVAPAAPEGARRNGSVAAPDERVVVYGLDGRVVARTTLAALRSGRALVPVGAHVVVRGHSVDVRVAVKF